MDSAVLLDLLHRWRQCNEGPPLSAIHVHHGLHPDADRWSSLCGQLCDERDLPLEVHRVEPMGESSMGLEAAARTVRYQVFDAVLEPGDVLFMAHHGDDQAETVLYRLLRGSGPRGLMGMPRRRDLGRGELVRPLLDTPRAELAVWASTEDLEFVVDPSNADDRFDRNYLRHRVLPVIEDRWPGYRQTLQRSAALQRLTVDALEREPLPRMTNRFGDEALLLEGVEDDDVLAGLLHRWLTLDGWMIPSRRRLSEFARQLLRADDDRQPTLELGGWALRRWRGAVYRLRVVAKPPRLPPTVTAGSDASGDWGSLLWCPASPGIPTGTVLDLRYRARGETLAPRGGPTRSFSQLCQERGLPPWWRDRIPLLCRDGAPIAVPGVALLRGVDGLQADPATATVTAKWLPPDIASSIEQGGAC